MKRSIYTYARYVAGVFPVIALTVASASGNYANITVDGDMSDWAGITPIITDADEGFGFDINQVFVANNATDLFVLITFNSAVNPNSGNGLFLGFDNDSSVATGYDVYGAGLIGTEVAYQNDFAFEQATGVFNTGATTNAAVGISPYNVTTSFQEFSISRSAVIDTVNNDLLFPNETFDVIAYFNDADSDVSGVGSYSFTSLAELSSSPDYYVSTGGSNTADGSALNPWETITYAASQAVAGDVVNVSGGTYNERVVFPESGSAGSYIVFRAVTGETPIIDGTGISVSGREGLFELNDKSYVRIEGFTLQNYASVSTSAVPVGILIEGGGDGLEIVANTIESIASTATVDANLLGRDAHGIAVYGNSTTPISDLLIRDNELRNLTLGSSEAMVINGNVDGFRLLDNHVHDCDNIGIDAIGYEGTGPTDPLDQARNGLIARNVVENITTITNPAYGGGTSAGGIYVDGGRDIVIERNIVSNCDIGIEVASEHLGKVTSGIVVRSNLIRENLMGGLFIGGYNANSTGDADDCLIAHNTFYNNDTDASGDEYGQIYIQYRVTNTDFVSNILYHDITKSGEYNIFLVQWNATGGSMTFDRNLYYGPDTPVSVIANDWIEGFAAYEALAISGLNEAWGNPLFVAPGLLDFSLQDGSPGIGLGDATFISAGERDLLDHKRIKDAIPDAGAIENGSVPPDSGSLSIEAGDSLTLDWATPSGALYTLEQCSDLQNWYTLPGYDSEFSVSGIESIRLLPLVAQKQFFRVTFD